MKVYIEQFGPIKDAQIEFAPMVVFTGDSNLGKSYVNYLLYYLVYSLNSNIQVYLSKKLNNVKKLDVTTLSIEKWLDGNVEIFMRDFLNAPELTCKVHYELFPDGNDKSYHIEYKERKVHTDTDEQLNREDTYVTVRINDIEVKDYYVFSFLEMTRTVISRTFAKVLQKDVFGKEINQAFILPPARGAFVGENYTLKDKIASSVGMYRQFLVDYDHATLYTKIIRRNRKQGKYAKQIERLLRGKLISKEDKQYLVLENGTELPLSAAASSIKELSPLLFTIQSSSSKISFCIEEPEAHLHPQMQVAVVDLIANCFNDEMFFQFTTHSDYVIQRLNQLIKLDYVRSKSKEQFKVLCDKYGFTTHHCVDREKVKVYFFRSDRDGNVKIEDLQITDKGVPMATFLKIVGEMNKIEDDLDNVIEDLCNDR